MAKMNKEDTQHIINESLKQLKDFQLKTVEAAYNRLYESGENRYLVADEVGLGKTIVAKGLIARIMQAYLDSKNNNQFRVIYICSNQALAKQNLIKLNIFKDPKFIDTEHSRLIFYALNRESEKQFSLSSLTPSTSFKLIGGVGRRDERKLIFAILSHYNVYRKNKRYNNLKLFLKGPVRGSIQDWYKEVDRYVDRYKSKIRKEVFTKFEKKIASYVLPYKGDSLIYKETGFRKEATLKKVIIKYLDTISEENYQYNHGYFQVISILRKILADICIDFLKADLFILDEFQRFRDLVKTPDDKSSWSEATEIANRIFQIEGAKVLLLSATPFKPYTTKLEEVSEDSHFSEFQTVLNFLLRNNQLVNDFSKYRKAFFDVIRRPESIRPDIIPDAKIKLENLYRKVISRTERLIVSDDKNSLIRQKHFIYDKEHPIKIKKQDIDDFIIADSLIQALEEIKGHSIRSIQDFVVSSPYPFSFLDGYKVKKMLGDDKSNWKIQNAVRKSSEGWVDWDAIQNYRALNDIPNAKLRYLMSEVFDSGLWKQLWIAPSLPYYELRGAFYGSENNSKILLFSKWVMVPKMVAALLSYRAERLTIGNKNTLGKDEPERVYIPPMGPKKRQPLRPTKILALKMKEGKPNKMNAFTLLYPSITLSRIYNPVNNVTESSKKELDELKADLRDKIKTLIEQADLQNYCSISRKTVNWYWVAPLLLDRHFNWKETLEWLKNVNKSNSSFLQSYKASQDDEEGVSSGAAFSHFNELKNIFYNPSLIELGQMPDDLAEVLSEMVLGSPAICASRTLSIFFPHDSSAQVYARALDIASKFHSLFDKPVSIAVIHLNSESKKKHDAISQVYWHEVLKYCMDGCLQSVLDEFGHLIYSDYMEIDDFVMRLENAININTSTVKVDSADSFLKGETKMMRCHFAVDFGNQNMEREEGQKRIISVLDNFNSPFRPFVLASTSIGQEGLDFHYYCRKLAHWNLPSNPIDLEQREGRINRFKGLVIRQNIAKKYSSFINTVKGDIWEELFRIAREIEGEGDNYKSHLVPFWHVENDGVFIDRIILSLPYSKEAVRLNQILANLALYRLTFGQPRQEELVETLFKKIDPELLPQIRENLMIDLSPISYLVNK